MENQNLKWHQKPVSVILLLIFFFPLGLYFMWKNGLWTKTIRWVVSGAFALIVVAGSKNERVQINPCDCADIGSKVQIIGYNNLTEKQKKTFSACEKKYTTPAAAFEDCVEKNMPK